VNAHNDIVGKFMQLPMNRVRQICQLDTEDYTLVSKQALVLITKATELFVQDLAGVCGQIAKQ
jgi:histone H3/H4